MSDRRGLVPGRRAMAQLHGLVTNILTSRLEYMKARMDGPNRDLNKECGYPECPTLSLYRQYYDREGIATRVVGVLPDECWSVYPELYEKDDETKTPFEEDWDNLVSDQAVWYYLHRIDRLSGIGQFGIMFLGFDDGLDPKYPVKGVGPDGKPDGTGRVGTKLQFIRTYDQSMVQIRAWDTSKQSPRFGLPVSYTINSVVDTASGGAEGAFIYKTEAVEVHWTRVIHVADNRETNEALGVPRMQPVLNRLHDLRKLLGGSAEMFWKGAFPGYALEALPDVEDAEEPDDETIAEQMVPYMNGLKRYLSLVGMSIKSLAPQVADPSNHISQQLLILAAAIETPLPVLLGQMVGQLAGDQNIGTWNRRLGRRQSMYLTPMLINPFTMRMVAVGVCRPPDTGKWKVDWCDLNAMTEKDKADVAVKKTQALLQYVTSGAEVVMTPTDFLTYILEMPVDQVAEIIARATAVKAPDGYVTEIVWQKQPDQSQNPAGKTGISGKTNSQSAPQTAA